MRMTRREFIPVALVAIPGAAIIGRGMTIASQQGGTPSASPIASPGASPMASPGASPVAGGGTEVTVEMVDIDFNPNEFTIPANTDVTVQLPNNGVLPHNFNIDALNIHSEDVQGGGSTTVTINAPAGTYEYYCSIPGHAASGMVGTLTVQ